MLGEILIGVVLVILVTFVAVRLCKGGKEQKPIERPHVPMPKVKPTRSAEDVKEEHRKVAKAYVDSIAPKSTPSPTPAKTPAKRSATARQASPSGSYSQPVHDNSHDVLTAVLVADMVSDAPARDENYCSHRVDTSSSHSYHDTTSSSSTRDYSDYSGSSSSSSYDSCSSSSSSDSSSW